MTASPDRQSTQRPRVGMHPPWPNDGLPAAWPRVDTLPAWLSDSQAAFVLGKSVDQIRRAWRGKALKGRLIGKALYLNAESVRAAWRAKHTVVPREAA